jgi:hypothetical protein
MFKWSAEKTWGKNPQEKPAGKTCRKNLQEKPAGTLRTNHSFHRNGSELKSRKRRLPGIHVAPYSSIVSCGAAQLQANGAMRGAVLVGFSSLQEMEARVRENSLGDAMVTYAESANHLPHNPPHETYVVIGIANADKSRLKSCMYENTLYFKCTGCHKVQIPESAEQVDSM